jgi:hypothetical protein
MASTLTTLRDLINAAIVAKKATNGFVDNSFDVAAAWIPYTRVEDLPAGGKVWLVGLASDFGGKLSRTNTCKWELAVQIGFQKVCQPTDVAAIDSLVELVEQFRNLCRKEVDPDTAFSWNRDEVAKDENGTPYAFTSLRDVSVFESYFTAYFDTTLQ